MRYGSEIVDNATMFNCIICDYDLISVLQVLLKIG